MQYYSRDVCVYVGNRHLPEGLQIIGYARSKLSDADLREKVKPNLKGGSDKDRERFLQACTYVAGSYDESSGYQALTKALKTREKDHAEVPIGRLFYLALPPSVYPQVESPSHRRRNSNLFQSCDSTA